MTGSPIEAPAPMLAKECRKSCKRTLSSPAAAVVIPQTAEGRSAVYLAWSLG